MLIKKVKAVNDVDCYRYTLKQDERVSLAILFLCIVDDPLFTFRHFNRL